GVSHNGRLVLARGYGQDAAGRPVEPDVTFPIGPIAQALNQAASLRLGASPANADQIQGAILKPLGIDHIRFESGEWIGSVSDILRFANALDGCRPPALLTPEKLQAMFSPNSDWWVSGLFRQAATGVDIAILFDSPPSDPAFSSELKT